MIINDYNEMGPVTKQHSIKLKRNWNWMNKRKAIRRKSLCKASERSMYSNWMKWMTATRRKVREYVNKAEHSRFKVAACKIATQVHDFPWTLSSVILLGGGSWVAILLPNIRRYQHNFTHNAKRSKRTQKWTKLDGPATVSPAFCLCQAS